MLNYIGRRLLSTVPVLLVVAAAIFGIIRFMPGDPARAMLGADATDEQVAALQEQLGLNAPVLEQFFSWFGGALTGDLGDSYFLRMPVLDAIVDQLGPTLTLAILAELVAIAIAVPAGIIAANKRGTAIDQSIMGTSMMGLSVPSFLLGLLLVMGFAVQLRWLPASGYRPLSEGLGEALPYLVLPTIALGAIQASLIARMTRSAMLDTLANNYIRTARAKGVGRMPILLKHALKNASLPILTVIGQSFGTLIAGAVVIETVFNIPGIGQLTINSIKRRDFDVIQGVVLLAAVSYVLINLLVDVLYGIVDPRVRVGK